MSNTRDINQFLRTSNTDVLLPSHGTRPSAADQGSSLLDPITNANAWHFVLIANQRSPGIVAAVDGFERETGWDVKKGKGAAGAQLTQTTQPPAKGKIVFHAWEPIHFTQWAAYLPILRYTPGKAASQAVAIYYPSLADLGINSVVISKISPLKHIGRGKYERFVEMIEWTPPPKKSIVSSPTKAVEQNAPQTPGLPPDPIADAQQKEIARLLTIAQGSGNGPLFGP
jgi:hypothetical protein